MLDCDVGVPDSHTDPAWEQRPSTSPCFHFLRPRSSPLRHLQALYPYKRENIMFSVKTPEQEAGFSLRNLSHMSDLSCPFITTEPPVLVLPGHTQGLQTGERGASVGWGFSSPRDVCICPHHKPQVESYPTGSSRVSGLFWCFLLLSPPPLNP